MVRFRRLTEPAGDCSASQALAGWRAQPQRRAGRPRVALNMIASVDGRTAIGGRSGELGGPADRELFHALRAQSDAVLAAAGTVRSERYGPLIRDAKVRAQRVAAGLAPAPLAVIVSRSLALAPQLPLLADPDSRVVIITPSPGTLAPTSASIDYIRAGSLADGLVELGATYGVGVIVCEGGPTLGAGLLRGGLIDELFLTLSPQLVGGDPGMSLLSDEGTPVPTALELKLLLEHDSMLFAHYVVRS
jgi:riboflavin biosynthesis pyrimidine reductase